MKRWTPAVGTTAALMLAGCIALPTDRDATTTSLLRTHSDVGSDVSANESDTRSEAAKILAAPMNADAAVLLALLQSPRMRVLYAQLGFAHADSYDASRLSNPALGYLHSTNDGGASKTIWSLSQSFTELFFLGYRTRVGRSQLLQAQQTAASKILQLEADVSIAYYEYVSAVLVAQMRERVVFLTDTSAQYAQQLFDAGNISALQLSREQAMASEARIEQRSADIVARTALANLMNMLGLPLQSETAAQFVITLPLPMQFNADVKPLQEWALAQRLDLQASREHVRVQSINLGHARRWRWLGGVQGVAEREHEADETSMGLGAELQLPLFNQGGGKLLRASAGFESAQATLLELETGIGNDVAVRHAALQAAYDNVEEYRQKLVPLRERIVTLSQQQQTYMLIGTFELLSAKQQEMDTYQAYLEAVRDYWIAHTELRRAAGGKLPTGTAVDDSGIAVGLDAQVTGMDAVPSTQQIEGIDHQHHLPVTQPTTGETP